MTKYFSSPVYFFAIVFLISCSPNKNEQSNKGNIVYTNAARGVKYVGSEKCAACHEEIYETYRHAEMANSMAKFDPSNPLHRGQYPQKGVVYDSVRNFYYQVVKNGDHFYQREYRLDKNKKVIHERMMEIEYIIGSGNNDFMYFSDENGMLYELPLTWYVHRNKWDLSPGYRDFGNLRFSRYASAICVSCHTSYLEEYSTANDRYRKPSRLGIGCERCHGPGELHVKQMVGEKLEGLSAGAKTIVNPKKLPYQQQLDVCNQCHLQGKAWALLGENTWFDYRPGTPLKTHRSVYFPAAIRKDVVEVGDSPQRLALSRCFKESNGTMTCFTCHNPHKSIKTFPIEHYNNKCIACHVVEKLPGASSRFAHSAKDDCVSCHMNRTGSDNTLHGVSSTDHWIRVDAETKMDWTILRLPADKQPITRLNAFLDTADAEVDIRRGLAYLDYYKEMDRRKPYLDSAHTYLNRGLSNGNNAARGLYALGETQLELGHYEAAVVTLRKAIDLVPGHTDAHSKLGNAHSALQRNEDAIRAYRQAVALKPEDPEHLENLGIALADGGFINEAVKILEQALTIDRQSPHAFLYLAEIYALKLQQPQKALNYFKEAAVLDPDFPESYLKVGNTYFLLKEYTKAIAWYEKELTARPESAMALYNVGRSYDRLGKKNKARTAFQNAARLNPSLNIPAEYVSVQHRNR